MCSGGGGGTTVYKTAPATTDVGVTNQTSESSAKAATEKQRKKRGIQSNTLSTRDVNALGGSSNAAASDSTILTKLES